jgi:DNA-binding GntR family transcriptional regulator
MKRKEAIKPLISELTVRIAERIKHEAMPEGSHLVEQALADAFQVSRSPVREALRILEAEGIVRFNPNRGFFVARAGERIRIPDIDIPVPAEEEKYRRMAEDRIRGRLQGHVSETELMSRYGVSRVKLMKILMRINQEGWIERRPGHGWNFPPILDSAEALDQGYRFRMLIEPAALMEPTYRVDPLLFARLRSEQEAFLAAPISERTPFKLFDIGARFHEQIISCSGNRFYLEAIRHVNRLRRLIEYSLRVDAFRLNHHREHIEIMTLLERGRRATAAALLRDHIDQARENKTEDAATGNDPVVLFPIDVF